MLIAGQECDCVSLCDHVTVFYIIIVWFDFLPDRLNC